MENLKEFSNYTNKQLDWLHLESIKKNAYSHGIEDIQLAEIFGSKIADYIEKNFNNIPIFLVCGIGEKSSYGLVAARYLSNKFNVNIIFLNDKLNIKNYVTKHNYYIINNLISISFDDISAFNKLNRGIIIDAILDYDDEPTLSSVEMIKIINKTKNNNIKIFSIEYPSSVKKNNISIKPDYIFSLYKELKEIKNKKIIKIDINLPIETELLTGLGDLYLATKKKALNSNKYSNGSLLILGGGEKYHGAPISATFSAFNTLAALRTSLGYVTIALPNSILNFAKQLSSDIIVESFGEKFDNNSVKKITRIKHDTLIVGPGMDKTNETLNALNNLINLEIKNNKKIIIDATALSSYLKIKNHKYKNIIITPHEGEFEHLIDKSIKELSFNEKIKIAIDFAGKNKCTLVLKGQKTIITDGELLKINISKTPTLATMGTGDVLDGIIAAYFTISNNPFESAVAGVYLHSEIGDKLFKEKGTHIIAEDVINELPIFLKYLNL